MARIDQILIDRAWVYPNQPDLIHYIIKDIDDNESHLVTPRKSKLGKILEAEVGKLGKDIQAPAAPEDEEPAAEGGDEDPAADSRCERYAFARGVTPSGICDHSLDANGDCPNSARHVDFLADLA